MVENAEARAREARARRDELIASLRVPRPPHTWWQGNKEPIITSQDSHSLPERPSRPLTPTEQRFANALRDDWMTRSVPPVPQKR
jgi:hypothetical protein